MQEQIFEALRRGAHDEALAMAREAVEAEPESARAHGALAAALNAAGDREAALRAIDQALALDGGNADLQFRRGLILMALGDADAARDALARSVEANPNHAGAYLVQAQLALGRGDLEEAGRASRLLARVDPGHPWSRVIDGMLALARGNVDEALARLTEASKLAPDDPQVLLSLALAYIARGHDAFAEQALRRLVGERGGAPAWHIMLAETLLRQRRPEEALDALRPLLSEDGKATPAVERLAGEIELVLGRPEAALQRLRKVLAAEPGDVRALRGALAAWQRLGELDGARAALDDMLAATPQAVPLWHARLSLEPGAEAARGVVGRWLGAAPDSLAALEADMQLSLREGNAEAALARAKEIVARVPGHAAAQSVVVEDLRRRDPAAAVAYVRELLPNARTRASRDLLTGWLAMLEDGAGMYGEAAGHWQELAARQAPAKLPLPPVSLPPEQVPAGAWPGRAQNDGDSLDTLFLWGPPGSCVENVAAMLAGIAGFRADRMSPAAPGDVFQRFASVGGLSTGDLDAAQAAADWRTHLSARGIRGERVIEWLVWWDNALLRVLRPHVPRGALLFVVRDPRDMLLHWLAAGSPMQIGIPSLQEAAWWLDLKLRQIVEVFEGGLYPASLLRIDGVEHDVDALKRMLAESVGIGELPSGAPVAPPRLPPGHWRRYAEVLAGPFATLAPVAKRLGYPEE